MAVSQTIIFLIAGNHGNLARQRSNACRALCRAQQHETLVIAKLDVLASKADHN
jgi:hypothetical protein